MNGMFIAHSIWLFKNPLDNNHLVIDTSVSDYQRYLD